MFLAENAEAAEKAASTFTAFDIFMLLFTLLIIIGLIKTLLARPRKNWVALGFGTFALVVFLIADVKMISGW
jgi:hypothetical protein